MDALNKIFSFKFVNVTNYVACVIKIWIHQNAIAYVITSTYNYGETWDWVEWTRILLVEGSQTFTLFLHLCSSFVSFSFLTFPSLSTLLVHFVVVVVALLVFYWFFSFWCVFLLLPCWLMTSMVKFHGIHLSSKTKLHSQTCNAHM